MTRGKPFGDDHPPPRQGRKKGARGRRQIVTEIAHESYQIPINGKGERVNTIELVLLLLDEAANKGDLRAQKECDRLTDKYGPSEQQGGFLVVPGPYPKEIYGQLIELHNSRVVQPDPPTDTHWTP
jgi:hypothetical protein